MSGNEAIKLLTQIKEIILNSNSWDENTHKPITEAFDMAINSLEERKTGKWIYHIDDLFPMESTKECDQCRTEQDLNCDGNFCPWCGAKMEGEEE